MKLQLASMGALSLLTFTTPVTRGEDPHGPVQKEAQAEPILKDYAGISTALFKDDLAAAKKAAEGMIKHDKDSAMAKHCQAIVDSKTIEQAREHFKQLSDVAIPIAKKAKTMHVMHCPMAFDNKGADWLQSSAAEVKNPYFGAKMPHCGEVVK